VRHFFLPLLLIATSLFSASTGAQTRLLQPGDASRWTMLGPYGISSDGRWVGYETRGPGGRTASLLEVESGVVASVLNGHVPVFTRDARWAIVATGADVVVRDLRRGGERRFEGSAFFELSSDERRIALQGPRGLGELRIVELESGQDWSFGRVDSFAWSPDGRRLAAVCVREDGQQLAIWREEAEGQFVAAGQKLQKPVWSHDSNVVAVLTDAESGAQRLVRYRLDSGELEALDESAIPFPDARGFGTAAPMLGRGGDAVLFPLRRTRAENLPNIEIWTTADRALVATLRHSEADGGWAVWAEGGTVRRVADSAAESVVPVPGTDEVLVYRPSPGRVGTGLLDVDLVRLGDGKRTSVAQAVGWTVLPCPGGRRLAYFKGSNWWIFDREREETLRATTFDDARMAAAREEVPAEKRPHAPSAWLDGGRRLLMHGARGVYLYDASSLELREVAEATADAGLSAALRPGAASPDLVVRFDRSSKMSSILAPTPTGELRRLWEEEVGIGAVRIAAAANRALFAKTAFDRPRDLYLADLETGSIERLTNLNPQQAEYRWSRVERVAYASRWGAPLEGKLMFPAGYEEGKRYPMVVYVYERQSDDFHAYYTPRPDSMFDVQGLLHAGYFVFMPDVAFRPGDPGVSAVECLEPALDAALARAPAIDPERVALVGFSWGGYQAAFVSTVSNRFAAAVSALPLIDLGMMYRDEYEFRGRAAVGSQVVRYGQGRMLAAPWEDPAAYARNSPIEQAHRRTAPLLLAVAENDRATHPFPAMQLYHSLRSLGKPCVLLLYRDEDHQFTRPENDADLGRRIRHFLDVHLMGAAPATWMRESTVGLPPSRSGGS
jgi:dipeptidyl aminopeptidase/acylaminoacyl peptidase